LSAERFFKDEVFLADQITCPYCGYEHRDSWEWAGGGEATEETECSECEREFLCSRVVSVSYTTRKLEADHA
jgi:DNA-directed RNA polymerase subunit RPC12/RpoP